MSKLAWTLTDIIKENLFTYVVGRLDGNLATILMVCGEVLMRSIAASLEDL